MACYDPDADEVGTEELKIMHLKCYFNFHTSIRVSVKWELVSKTRICLGCMRR